MTSIGIDPAEKGEFHEDATRDRHIGNGGALRPDRAGVVAKHEHNDLVGKCQVFHDPSPFTSRAMVLR